MKTATLPVVYAWLTGDFQIDRRSGSVPDIENLHAP
jgi:hypothetical protein